VCGIAGIVDYKGSGAAPRQSDLLTIRDTMASRGPDGYGEWWSPNGRIGLSHRRLAIIDLEDRARQPMHHPSGLSIIFNGEIYNYRALRDQLRNRFGITFITESDTEVLLALFSAYGPDMVHHLRGMFAFAIWDEKRGRLFLARDHYGIKPLYYADEGGVFQFASQVKALLASPSLSREAEPAGLVGFQIFGSVPEPFTIYRSIRALPAGCRMWVEPTGPTTPERYASVSALLAAAERNDSSSIDAVVADAALDSVRAHLVADVEVGAFLSSGIDSGALIGLMRDTGQSRIRAVTLEFEELKTTSDDEVPLARKVAGQYGAEHYVRTVTRDEFSRSAERILNDMDQPSIDGVNSWFVSQAAHECSLKVVLSGLGGDELLGGYSTFRTIPATRRYAGGAAKLPFAREFAKFALKRFAPEWCRRNPKALGLLDYAGSWEGSYLLRRAVTLPFELGRSLEPDMVREGLERLRPLQIIQQAMEPDPVDSVRRVSALESSLYMRNQLLRDSDWASMAHSLELRVPYVDWTTLGRIAPIQHRLVAGRGKRALARSPSLPLPPECMSRARSGFNIPVAKWIGATIGMGDRLGSRHWSQQVSRAFGLS
jgi:asparagine synthase (glutamine-hydrolysing)